MDVDSIGEDLDPYVIAARRRIEEQQASLALANTNAPRLEDNSGSMTPTFSSDLFNAGTVCRRTDSNPLPPPGFEFSSQAPIMFTTDHGKELLNIRNLSPESVTQAEEFLRNQDMLRIMFKDSTLKYKPTEDVKKIPSQFHQDAMREMKIPDLPPAHETGCCKVISAECGGALIHGRHAIKEKQEREAAEKASRSTGVVSKPMETTKKRRTKNYEQILDDFWGIVDKKLESYRTQVPDTAIRFEYVVIISSACKTWVGIGLK
ncbi:hypothetical protein EV368DRAFT_63729, partial [Lentinula lateritia]